MVAEDGASEGGGGVEGGGEQGGEGVPRGGVAEQQLRGMEGHEDRRTQAAAGGRGGNNGWVSADGHH